MYAGCPIIHVSIQQRCPEELGMLFVNASIAFNSLNCAAAALCNIWYLLLELYSNQHCRYTATCATALGLHSLADMNCMGTKEQYLTYSS